MKFRQVYFTEETKIPEIWYHGTKTDFDKFDLKYAYLENKSIAQFGPGFYLAKDKDLAEHYAGNNGYVKTFSLSRKERIYDSESKPKLTFAKIGVNNIPKDKLDDVLSNWDENPTKAKKLLIESLMNQENLGEQIQAIWYDCFRYREPEFVKIISSVCDGITFTEKGEDILVCYNPDILKLIKMDKI